MDIFLEMELLDNMVVLFLIFQGASILFSIVPVPVSTPTNIAQGFIPLMEWHMFPNPVCDWQLVNYWFNKLIVEYSPFH